MKRPTIPHFSISRKVLLVATLLIVLGLIASMPSKISHSSLTNGLTVKANTRFRPNPLWRNNGLNTLYTVANDFRISKISFEKNALHLWWANEDFWLNTTSGSGKKVIINEWSITEDWPKIVQLRILSNDEFIQQLYSSYIGRPETVTGAANYSWNRETSILTFSTYEASTVTISFTLYEWSGLKWYMDRIPMWMGLGGFLILAIGPVLVIHAIKKGDWDSALIMLLAIIIFSFAFIVAWLWS